MKGVIYKYTFPDGKVYIGQTRNPEKRKREHIDPKTGPVNTGFWEAYQRFGTFEYAVIREIESDNEDELIDLLNRWESGYIYQYQADNPEYGYNRTSYASVGIKSRKILQRVYNAIQEDYFKREMELFIKVNPIEYEKEMKRRLFDEKLLKKKMQNKKIFERVKFSK